MTRESAERRRAETAGRLAETAAELFLRLKGFSILVRRYRAPGGELDLVVRRGRLVAFVEVKARRAIDEALFSITDRNRRRIEAAAMTFIGRHPHLAECDTRYDIIAIAGWRLRHVPDAWRHGD